MTMADRCRKGISTNESHDQRITRKPVDDNMFCYGSSFEDGSQQDRNKSTPRVRDSGYNTDVSPARTSSSTSTPADHCSFVFPEQTSTANSSTSRDIPVVRPRSSPPSSRSTLPAIPSCQSNSPEVSTGYHLPQRDAELYQISHLSKSAPGGHGYVTHPPPSVLFDSNPDTTVDEEGMDEIDGWVDPSLSSSQNLSVDTALLPKKMSNSFQDLRDGEEGVTEEDDVMTSSEEKEMEERFLYSNVRKMSLRRRNYSGPDEEDTAAYRTESTYRFNDDDLGRDYIDQTSPELAHSIKNTCQLMIGLHIDPACDVIEKAHNSSQDFINRERFADDNDDADSNSDNDDNYNVLDDDGDEEVFSFDAEDIRNYESSSGSNSSSADIQFRQQTYDQLSVSARSPALPSHVVLDRPPISPSSRGRKSKARPPRAIIAHLQLAGGARLPWEEGPGTGSSSAATQTPHRTSTMIQEIVSTPVALPSEARGTAYMHLRRGSADISTLVRNHPVTPLPDIIPMSRDRAQSAPNLQDILMRQRAQTAGRELRRLSDLFHENVVRRNSENSEDNDSNQSSSYPRTAPSFLRRESMRALLYARSYLSRRGSSVDDESFPTDDDSDS